MNKYVRRTLYGAATVLATTCFLGVLFAAIQLFVWMGDLGFILGIGLAFLAVSYFFGILIDDIMGDW